MLSPPLNDHPGAPRSLEWRGTPKLILKYKENEKKMSFKNTGFFHLTPAF